MRAGDLPIREGVLCPECGSSSATLISPGFVRCSFVHHWTVTEQVGSEQVPVVAMVPTPAGPLPAVVGIEDKPVFGPVERSRDCGCCYHLGPVNSTAPMCACNIFAIGRCTECEIWLCGHHGKLAGGKFYCLDHAAGSNSAQPVGRSMSAAEADEHRRRQGS